MLGDTGKAVLKASALAMLAAVGIVAFCYYQIQSSGRLAVIRAQREESEKKKAEVLKDFERVVKVEILSYKPPPMGGIGSLIIPPFPEFGMHVVATIDSRKQTELFRTLMDEMRTMVRQGRSHCLVSNSAWLRLHIQNEKWVYHCQFDSVRNDFAVYTKDPWQLKPLDRWPSPRRVDVRINSLATMRFKKIMSNLAPTTQGNF